MITKNNRIAVSLPTKRDVKLEFDKGVALVKQHLEFCVLDVLFDSDCGFYKGQKVCLDGGFGKMSYKKYFHDGIEFTLISKDLVLGCIGDPPAQKPLTGLDTWPYRGWQDGTAVPGTMQPWWGIYPPYEVTCGQVGSTTTTSSGMMDYVPTNRFVGSSLPSDLDVRPKKDQIHQSTTATPIVTDDEDQA